MVRNENEHASSRATYSFQSRPMSEMVGLAPKQLGEAYISQHVALARAVECIPAPYVAWFLANEEGGQRQFAALVSCINGS